MRLTAAAACCEDGLSGGSNSARCELIKNRFHDVAPQ
jgi:hypothetical protein